MDDDPPLAQSVFSQPTEHLRLFDDAAVWAHVCNFYAKLFRFLCKSVYVAIVFWRKVLEMAYLMWVCFLVYVENCFGGFERLQKWDWEEIHSCSYKRQRFPARMSWFALLLFVLSDFFQFYASWANSELLVWRVCLCVGVVETFPSIGSVRVKHRGILLTLKGTVIRSGAIKMYEGERWYICQKCNHKWVLFWLLLWHIRIYILHE
jgi:DNA replicative helicase MCM subunit Mcm2 (Cdc46/Mcm family)